MAKLWHGPQKSTHRKQGVGDTNELAHASINPAHAGQHITQSRVKQALHGGQKQLGHIKVNVGESSKLMPSGRIA
jgi:hypothetical protein